MGLGLPEAFDSLREPAKVVLEACWNWGYAYGLLEEMDNVAEVVLAHPGKTRLIADAQIKTDRLDARGLAHLLRGNLVATARIPAKATRQRKNVLRRRLFWIRERTRVRNRAHALLHRQHGLEMPQVSDPFSKKGIAALKKLQLPEPDHWLLQQDLAELEELQRYINDLTKLR